jgi:hypothetical protein
MRRDGEGFHAEVDVFRMIEDVFYNSLLAETSRGGRVEAETVLYRRRPGNSFDRQYAKFLRPFGSVQDDRGEEFDFRVRMSQLILDREKRRLGTLAKRREDIEPGLGRPGAPPHPGDP